MHSVYNNVKLRIPKKKIMSTDGAHFRKSLDIYLNQLHHVSNNKNHTTQTNKIHLCQI
jgi:hypothetical protein